MMDAEPADPSFTGGSMMGVQRGTPGSEVAPVGAAGDAAPSPATQPAAPVAWPVTSKQALRPGSLLNDRYDLGQVIGRGGMSTVHRAYDRRTGREVAVKISRPAADVVDADGRTRREIDLLSALDDPGLVAVLDADVGDGAAPAYLVTELVDGPTLAQWISHSTLTEQQTARLGAAMCRTLAYIHARGIVHRDVKPANILISGRNEADLVAPKLADFGIAMAVNSTRLTAERATVGTANYLSPEQVHGDPLTPATDIYSLGLVLIEALTGALAYPGTSVDTAIARLTRPVIIPHNASRGMRTVLADMTARHPLDRPDAARAGGILEELAADSAGSLTDEILMLDRPETEPDEQPLLGTRTAPRRRIVLAAAAAAVVIGCAALTATLTSTGSRPPRPAPHAASQAAPPNQPLPSPAHPTHAAPPKISPALRHRPAPAPTPAQIAAAGTLRERHANTAHLNGSPKHHHKNKDTHGKGTRRKGTRGKGRHGKGRHGKGRHGEGTLGNGPTAGWGGLRAKALR